MSDVRVWMNKITGDIFIGSHWIRVGDVEPDSEANPLFHITFRMERKIGWIVERKDGLCIAFADPKLDDQFYDIGEFE